MADNTWGQGDAFSIFYFAFHFSSDALQPHLDEDAGLPAAHVLEEDVPQVLELGVLLQGRLGGQLRVVVCGVVVWCVV